MIFSNLHSRRAIDRLRLAYALLVVVQLTCIVLYENALLPHYVEYSVALATSLLGPVFSLAVSLHIFSHRRRSRALDIVSVAATYLVTCVSFAILYAEIDSNDLHAFLLPAGSGARISLGTAIYFSIVTITTTGFGDIAPFSGLARIATCAEIATGLAYQVFIFSLAASLLSAARPPPTDR